MVWTPTDAARAPHRFAAPAVSENLPGSGRSTAGPGGSGGIGSPGRGPVACGPSTAATPEGNGTPDVSEGSKEAQSPSRLGGAAGLPFDERAYDRWCEFKADADAEAAIGEGESC